MPRKPLPIQKTLSNTGPCDLFNVREAAAAFNVSVDTIKRFVRNGDLLPTKVGTQLRFERAELDRYIAKQQYGQRIAAIRSRRRKPA